jgi:mannose-6-phosphate isomerase-like protein (cupin superfamily)
MESFELASLVAACSQSGDAYLEFIRHPSLSVGLYMLPAGATDTQEPHTEDEIYYVINGSATMLVDTENRPVKAGSTIFVAAHVEHRFHTITEDMTILVIFAPAEYTNAGRESAG